MSFGEAVKSLENFIKNDFGFKSIEHMVESLNDFFQKLEEQRFESEDINSLRNYYAKLYRKLFRLIYVKLRVYPTISNLFGFYLGGSSFRERMLNFFGGWSFLMVFFSVLLSFIIAYYGGLAYVLTQQSKAGLMATPDFYQALDLLSIRTQLYLEYTRYFNMIELYKAADPQTLEYMKAHNMTVKDLIFLRDFFSERFSQESLRVISEAGENPLLNNKPFLDYVGQTLADMTKDQINILKAKEKLAQEVANKIK